MDSYDEGDVPAEGVELPTVFASAQFTATLEGFDSVGASSLLESQQQVKIPSAVAQFLTQFHQHLVDHSTWELHAFYENSFSQLTEKFYAKTPWPEAESISHLVNDDSTFLILYKELYYRHIYSHLQPSLDERIGSYTNYCDLFNYILNSSDEPCELDLPSQWLWDIIDEFVYQFQSFSQYRNKLKHKTDEEIALLKERPDVWNVHNVLNVLYSLIQKSKINEQLVAFRNGTDMAVAAGELGSKQLYRMLGYFSLVGLLRVHCLLGDYNLALETMQNVDPGQRGLFSRITACHVTTYYYIGFAYLMMRRYTDAIKMFSNILNFVSRTKHYHTRSYQYEMISRRSDQMYALLTMCLVLSPQKIDENINNAVKEKYGDQYQKMQKGEESLGVFQELFAIACPKFISPSAPDLESNTPLIHDAVKHQTRIFLSNVKSQILVPTLHSYLKLYNNLPMDKLATFLDTTPEDVRRQLLVFKHKSRQVVWASGPLSTGSISSTTDLQLYLKQDVVYIAENKTGRRVADWFIRNMNKFEDIVASMEKKPTVAAAAYEST
ncbi:hypothetical protein BASA50_002927 [Batrachochytrium salamandrivorans]|uniref:Eukaryotic translation initiation factor 3 subunit L n=1 Tax=Batrachochytrium salamandrivorans TaxID=1357716 RepID=A0ABQ8FJY0_9FUNG|nr:hypothetical protein BASA62_000796 [Batrachochytrium salamandrivorans]KAH6587563.1 hypothetical protein BASA61_006289 [Batrachochytrium salamandrivorans]KAH6599585.1 hypothetical protein BASA50_002927 [Batrachochytrium salamandrivorans]KAH9267987.1 hypothetical protein BASA84_000453 [Batrachochytrium salamandrivorans]